MVLDACMKLHGVSEVREQGSTYRGKAMHCQPLSSLTSHVLSRHWQCPDSLACFQYTSYTLAAAAASSPATKATSGSRPVRESSPPVGPHPHPHPHRPLPYRLTASFASGPVRTNVITAYAHLVGRCLFSHAPSFPAN